MNNRMKVAMDIMHKVYAKIKPDHECSLEHPTPLERFENGYGLCGSYVIVFRHFLLQERIESRRIDVLSIFDGQNFNHTIAEVRIEGKWVVFCPTTNLCFGVSFEELLENPKIASEVTDAYISQGSDGRWDRVCGPKGVDPGQGFFNLTTERFYRNIVWWEVKRGPW